MIKSAVASVLAQDYRPIEIIIVDDGSTDGTLQACVALADQFPRIIEVQSQPNQGPGPARERGRLRARGEFIQYLDSDDLLLPGKFAAQIGALRRSPGSGIAYGVTRLVDFGGNVLAEPFKWTGTDHTSLFPGLLVDRWWCTHTPLYRRSVCDEIGPWSDLRYSQDWEYDARAGAMGTKLVNTHSLVSEHRTHADARQTGHGKWLAPADQVRFFSTLYDCALQTGVSHSTPEMRHFARWVFSRARRCGADGDAVSAGALLDLAAEASGDQNVALGIYALLVRILGWNYSGRIARVWDLLRNGKAGSRSLKQSWMRRGES
jgi:glycosyltransferase involved in cell wall biosynthesis